MNRLPPTRLRSARQRGITITEVLVTMAIAMVIMGAMISLFLLARNASSLGEQQGRIQENARFAFEYLSFDLRAAGFTGCASYLPVTNTLKNAASVAFNFAEAVQGFEASGTAAGSTYTLPASFPAATANSNWSPNLPAANPNMAAVASAGSDVVSVRVAGNPVRLLAPFTNAASLFLENTGNNTCPATINNAGAQPGFSGLCQGDLLVVSDCRKGRVFQATNLTSASGVVVHGATAMTPGNESTAWGGSSAPLAEQFGADAEVMKISTITYFVGPSASPGSGALFRQTGFAAAEEMVDGVENMQILYGEDTSSPADGIVDAYRSADAVGNWSNVITIRIALLMRSTEQRAATATSRNYDVNGTTIRPATDRHSRRVFSTTITLRNRVG